IESAGDVGDRRNGGGRRRDDGGCCVSTGAAALEAGQPIPRSGYLRCWIPTLLRPEYAAHPSARDRRVGRAVLARSAPRMHIILLYLLLLKATVTSFSGLTSLPVVRNDLVVRRQVLTDRQLNAAVAAGRSVPGPNGLYVVSVGYFIAGIPGAWAGWLAMVSPAFIIIPLLQFVGARAERAGL